MEDSIDNNLEMCEKHGKVPYKPFPGKFSLRITPELHEEVAGAVMSYLYPYLILTSSIFFSNNIYSYLRYIMEKINLYLDNCCFNRPYDDQSQLVIKLETEAKIAIQEKIKKGQYLLHWSYILDFENTNNPFIERKTEIEKWKELASSDIAETDTILTRMNKLCTSGIKSLDALHISCSIEQNCKYFLTVDKGILKKADNIREIRVLSPIEFIIEMEERNND